MGNPLRFGIIGTGMMGIEHILNLRIVPDSLVSAFADPHPQSQKWGRDTAGPDARLFEDHRELLTSGEVDAVIVCTPNHTHAEVLEDVFRSELPVMIEKPLCTTLEDCRRVEELAARHPALVWVGMEYRYMPPVTRLVEEARAGAVGRPHMLAIREHRFPFLPKVGNWNRFSRNTGGTLVEKCCHFFDLMNHILQDRPVRVYASAGQDVNHLDEEYDGQRPDILDNAFAVVDYASGARALLDLCMFAEASRNQEEISLVGDQGKLEAFIPDSNLVIGRRNPREIRTEHVPVEERILKAGGHHGSTYFEHLAFRRALDAGTPAEVTVRDGHLAVAMGIAAQRAAEERRPVGLAELGL